MKAITSGKRERWEKNEQQMKDMMISLRPKLTKLIEDKLGKDLIFIMPITQEFLRYKLEAFYPYETLPIKLEDIVNFAVPITTKRKCYIGWYNNNPFTDWINSGIITKDDCIFVLNKVCEFGEFKNFCYTVNIWMNVEGDLGLQFPECDKFHRIVHNVSGVVDDKVTFEDGIDNCQCGLKGDTFTIKNELP